MGTMIEFARPDRSQTKGYLATAGDGRPGVVVIQEWWGLNDQICGVADRFARAGYNALAPDLYKGRLTTEPDEANHLMTGLDFPAATHQDLRGAAQHLRGQSGKVAVMGFCMGGALTIAAAVHVPEADAAVKHEIYRYDAAHAFANERSAAYDVACADQAWERMSTFLRVQIA